MKPLRQYLLFLLTVTLWSTVCFALPDFFDSPASDARAVFTIAVYCTALAIGAFWLLLLATIQRHLAAVFLPIYGILGAVIAYYRVAYHATITPVILDATFHTNAGTVAGVIDGYLIGYVVLNAIIGIGLAVWRLRIGQLPKGWVLLLIGLVALPTYYLSNNRLHTSLNQRYPYNLPHNLYLYHQLNRLRHQPFEQPDAEVVSARETELTIVVMLGEAIRFDHLHINGYARPTTPHLDTLSGLRTLGDVYSMHTHTAASLPHLLTPADSLHPQWANNHESFIPYLKQQGFYSAWISNQDMGETYAHFIQSADTAVFVNADKSVFVFDRWTDGELLEHVSSILSAEHRKNLLVLHTIGAHWYYNNHVPEGFMPFAPVTTNKVVTQNDSAAIVNSYDNCVAYLDHVIDSTISMLRARNALLIYLSDHGESLGENGCWLHAAGAEQTKHPAGLIWCSPTLEKTYPDIAAYVDSIANIRNSTDFLFPLVMHAAGLRFYTPSHSLP